MNQSQLFNGQVQSLTHKKMNFEESKMLNRTDNSFKGFLVSLSPKQRKILKLTNSLYIKEKKNVSQVSYKIRNLFGSFSLKWLTEISRFSKKELLLLEEFRLLKEFLMISPLLLFRLLESSRILFSPFFENSFKSKNWSCLIPDSKSRLRYFSSPRSSAKFSIDAKL